MKGPDSQTLLASALSPRTISREEVAKIERMVQSYEGIWNNHRLSELGTLFTEDAEWVNVVGMWWRGRADVVKAHEVFHATMFREVNIRCSGMEIRGIAPDVAIATLTVEVDDYVTPDGREMNGVVDHLTFVLVKIGGEWLIASGHNTTVDPLAQPHNPIDHP
ncbi:MAG: SgcJ/EcaC family oxidoreductase [Candidatus Sulfotelmatobacter sp.]|jgi:uncharacterized protein (TIGR02246 family)